MNQFKTVRDKMIKKYWDAIVNMYALYGMDTFISFEMLKNNAEAFVTGQEIKYPIEVEVDYAKFMEEARELYTEV